MFSIKSGTLPGAWIGVLRAIHTQGEICPQTEYANQSKFINGVAISITNYQEEHHRLDPWCSPQRVQAYKDEFTEWFRQKRIKAFNERKDKNRDDVTQFKYLYYDRFKAFGEKELGKGGIDQVEWVIEQLRAGRFNSRRIRMVTWDPILDMDETNTSPPCLQSIEFYPRANGVTDVQIVYRSWDWFVASEANLIAINSFVSDIFTAASTSSVKYKLGTFNAWGENVHVYSDSFEHAWKVAMSTRP